MESMPESFEGVKRPVLQQLCKRFGLKANGKNVDMIKALTELQLKLTQTSNNEPAEDGPSPEGEDLPTCDHDTPGHSVFLETDKENVSMDCSTTSVNEDESRQRPLKKPQKAKRNGRARKGGRKKPPHSKNSSPLAPCESAPEQGVSLELNSGDVMDVGSGGMSPPNPQTEASPPPAFISPQSESSRQDSRKRKRQDSVPPELSASVGPLPISPPPSPSSQEPETKRCRHDTYNLSPSPNSSLDTPVAKKESRRSGTYSVSPCSLVTPGNSSHPTTETKNHRGDTSSVSPSPIHPLVTPEDPSLPVADPMVALQEQDEVPGGGPHEHSPPGSRKRQRDSSPEENHAKRPCIDSALPGPAEPNPLEDSPSDQDVHAQILSILKERVEERKKDPDYKPVFGSSDNDSKIPIRKTATKFNKLHNRQFNKMSSIVDYQRSKEQRAALLNSAKKPSKLSPNRCKTTVPRPGTGTKQFKPSVTSIKHASFRFGSTFKTPGKTTCSSAVKAPKTPKPTTGPAGENTLQQKPSARKSMVKPSYTAHKGKVPEFKFSLY